MPKPVLWKEVANKEADLDGTVHKHIHTEDEAWITNSPKPLP